MNFHNDEWIMEKTWEHLAEATDDFHADHIVGIFVQGSQNYGLDYEDSDIDTKLIVTPTLKEIAENTSPISRTHIRKNDEHIDYKDIRLYVETFRKHNPNFLEVLFTQYFVVSEYYKPEWDILVENREKIARSNEFRAIKAMVGVASQKFHALKHEYPSRMEWINRFGYDPKQLHHLFRIEEFMSRFIAGVPYEECMYSLNPEYLVKVKMGCHSLEEAEFLARRSMSRIEEMAKDFLKNKEDKMDPEVDELLKEIQYKIIEKSIRLELKREEER